jgi:hypothetical protein
MNIKKMCLDLVNQVCQNISSTSDYYEEFTKDCRPNKYLQPCIEYMNKACNELDNAGAGGVIIPKYCGIDQYDNDIKTFKSYCYGSGLMFLVGVQCKDYSKQAQDACFVASAIYLTLACAYWMRSYAEKNCSPTMCDYYEDYLGDGILAGVGVCGSVLLFKHNDISSILQGASVSFIGASAVYSLSSYFSNSDHF